MAKSRKTQEGPQEPALSTEGAPADNEKRKDQGREGDRAVTVIIAIILIVILAQVIYLWKNLSDTGGESPRPKGAGAQTKQPAAPKASSPGAKSSPTVSTSPIEGGGETGSDATLPPPDVYVAAFLVMQQDPKLTLSPKQKEKMLVSLSELQKFDSLKAFLEGSANRILTEQQKAFVKKRSESVREAQSLMSEEKMAKEILAKLKSRAGDVKAAAVPADITPIVYPVSITDLYRSFDLMEKELPMSTAQAGDLSSAALAFIKEIPRIEDISRTFDALFTPEQRSAFKSKILPALEKEKEPHQSLMARAKKELQK